MKTFKNFDKKSSTDEQSVEGHSQACQGDIGTEPLSDPCAFPESSENSGLVPVHQRRPQRPDVGARANKKQLEGNNKNKKSKN